MKTTVKFLNENYLSLEKKNVTVQGWVRSNRSQKEFGFLVLNDGSALSNLQIVYDSSLPDFGKVAKYGVGVAVTATGTLVLTPEQKQPYELKATNIILEGDCPE